MTLDRLFDDCITIAIKDCFHNTSYGVWTLGDINNTENSKVINDGEEDIVAEDLCELTGGIYCKQ